MTCSLSFATRLCSSEPRYQIFVKSYGFLSFAKTKNMSKSIGKNISENLSSKHSQKPLDHAVKYTTDALKTASNNNNNKKKKSKNSN